MKRLIKYVFSFKEDIVYWRMDSVIRGLLECDKCNVEVLIKCLISNSG